MSPPRTLELRGADVILLAMETRAAGGFASGNAALVLELDAPIAAARVAAAVTRFLPLCPWLGARLHRPLPWGTLCWRLPRDGPTAIPLATPAIGKGGLADLVDRELATPIDPRREPPLRISVAAGGAGAALVLTWAHALMDPHGAEHLVRLLAALDATPAPHHPWAVPPLLTTPPDPRPLRERGALARRGARVLGSLAPTPPRSLAAAAPGRGAAAPRHWRFPFAAAADRRRRSMPWRLAAVAAAMTTVFRRRGIPLDAPFLVPVSVERRARGEYGPVLGNQLAFHFASFPPPDGDDPAPLAAAIRDRLAEAVRHDEIAAIAAGMDFARLRPLRGMFRELPWARRGDFCSFHFADTGAILPDLAQLFGASLTGGYHVAAVPVRPGAGVFFSRRGDTETLLVAAAGGALDDADAAAIADSVGAAMDWAAARPPVAAGLTAGPGPRM